METYPEGLKSLRGSEQKNDVCLVLQFEAPKGFYEKFNIEDKDIQEEPSIVEEVSMDILNDSSIISKSQITLKDCIEEVLFRKKNTIEYIKLICSIFNELVNFYLN